MGDDTEKQKTHVVHVDPLRDAEKIQRAKKTIQRAIEDALENPVQRAIKDALENPVQRAIEDPVRRVFAENMRKLKLEDLLKQLPFEEAIREAVRRGLFNPWPHP